MTVGVHHGGAGESAVHERARELANRLADGFKAHDRKNREGAIEAFQAVDRGQFQQLDDHETRHAATAFVDALWAKDEIEFRHLRKGELDREGIRNADYSPVRQKLRERAHIIGADPKYAILKADAWRRHKAGGDYWTPFQQSQLYEIRAILRDSDYPRKPRSGQSGPGPEPLRYALAFELHDMKTPKYWMQGVEVMVPYFEFILRGIDDATT